ncbi:hypothetical protein FS837_011507 [Tulasnella sp. UAMH 9824]|nr:hypothetical protein FS837_011507 [Tulasnella sp. UAMH 9824]
MVRKAQSANRKGLAKNTTQEAKLDAAVAACIQRDTATHPASKKTIAKLAQEFDVKYLSLWHRLQPEGQRSHAEALVANQKLSPSKEKKLLEIILEFSNCGLPLTPSDIHTYALYMANSRKQGWSRKITLGQNRVGNFIDRHHHTLSTHWSSPLDSKRTSALTPQAVECHFLCIKETQEMYGIIPENDYGMDESNIMVGFSRKQRVVRWRGAKQQHSRRDGSRESYTVVKTICADGTVLKPSIIYKAKQFVKEWGLPENNLIQAQICRSDRGFMDGVLSLGWITFFDAQTREKARGKYCRLFVDNHTSHCTVKFLRYVVANKIMNLWNEERDRIEKDKAIRVCKLNFIVVYGCVHEKAFTLDLVKKAFEKIGIHPFNPEVITHKMMAPSKAHSMETGAPLTLPSPIHAIRNAVLASLIPIQQHPLTPLRTEPQID